MVSRTSSPPTLTFNHPQLGSMTGLVLPERIVQFRAIPYAMCPARFGHSEPLSTLPDANRDFTKPGFACPHTFDENDIHSGGRNPHQDPIQTSETECLILQINVPLECLQGHKQRPTLPVMVYIHGGGFVLGKIDANHNTAYIAEQSLQDARPVISASIQYRLGALGFLSTPNGESNFGLYDQRNALLWIQKFVSGFGGDPKAVTVFGESAGALSICAHLMSAPPSTGPLFYRAIIMSGVVGPQTVPLLASDAGTMFNQFLRTAGIEKDCDPVEQLRKLDVQRIVDASDMLVSRGKMWLPVQDDAWFGEQAGRITWDRIPQLLGRCDWVHEIVIGCTGYEGKPLGGTLAKLLTPSTFYEGISTQLGQKSADMLMDAYNITLNMDSNLFHHAVVRWVGDVVFDAPTHALCRYLTTSTDKSVYRYIFDVRNPFPNNPLFQQAHHWVDVYFIFRTLQFRYPTERLKQISDRHAQLWVEFANGNEPWRKYKYSADGNECIMVANERDGWVVRSEEEDERIEERSNKRLESLLNAWSVKKGEVFSPLSIISLEDTKLV